MQRKNTKYILSQGLCKREALEMHMLKRSFALWLLVLSLSSVSAIARARHRVVTSEGHTLSAVDDDKKDQDKTTVTVAAAATATVTTTSGATSATTANTGATITDAKAATAGVPYFPEDPYFPDDFGRDIDSLLKSISSSIAEAKVTRASLSTFFSTEPKTYPVSKSKVDDFFLRTFADTIPQLPKDRAQAPFGQAYDPLSPTARAAGSSPGFLEMISAAFAYAHTKLPKGMPTLLLSKNPTETRLQLDEVIDGMFKVLGENPEVLNLLEEKEVQWFRESTVRFGQSSQVSPAERLRARGLLIKAYRVFALSQEFQVVHTWIQQAKAATKPVEFISSVNEAQFQQFSQDLSKQYSKDDVAQWKKVAKDPKNANANTVDVLTAKSKMEQLEAFYKKRPRGLTNADHVFNQGFSDLLSQLEIKTTGAFVDFAVVGPVDNGTLSVFEDYSRHYFGHTLSHFQQLLQAMHKQQLSRAEAEYLVGLSIDLFFASSIDITAAWRYHYFKSARTAQVTTDPDFVAIMRLQVLAMPQVVSKLLEVYYPV